MSKINKMFLPMAVAFILSMILLLGPMAGANIALAGKAEIAINNIAINCEQNTDGLVKVEPTKAEADNIIAAAKDGAINFNFGDLTNITGLEFKIDPAWFNQKNQSMNLKVPNIGDANFSSPMLKRVVELTNSADSKLAFILKKQDGELNFNLQKDNADVEWYDFENPVLIAIDEKIPADISTFQMIIKDQDQNTVTRSWYKDDLIYAKIYTTGTYHAEVAGPTQFTDTAQKWMREAVAYTAPRGIIKGSSEGKFMPEKAITRADYITMLMRATGIQLQGAWMPAPWADEIDIPEYATKYVAMATAMGIVKGDEANKFNPNDNISRQDMLVMAKRAMESLNMLPNEIPDIFAVYDDWDDVAAYAGNDIQLLAVLGLVKGYNKNIYPLDNASRADVAQVLYNIFKYDAK